MSRPYAEVIGDPITQSKSPLIHNFWLDKLGIDAEYHACHVTPDGLAEYFARRREDATWRGCNVTIPHKVSTVKLVDHLFPEAKVVGAINTVFRVDDKLVGNNTDLRGFAEPFRDRLGDRGSAMIFGTGGAARAVFVALSGLGFSPIFVAGRSREKARSFLEGLGQRDGDAKGYAISEISEPLGAVDLLVNTTSLGMTGKEPLTVDLSQLEPTAIVYDIVYSPLETELLRQARARNLDCIDGLTMLIGQADAAFRHFFDGEPPREHDAELRALLTA